MPTTADDMTMEEPLLAGVPVPGSRDGQVRGQPLVVFGYSQAGIADLEQRNLPTARETSPNISVGHALTLRTEM